MGSQTRLPATEFPSLGQTLRAFTFPGFPEPDGWVSEGRYGVRWGRKPRSDCEFVVRGDTVEFVFLRSQHPGLYHTMCDRLPAFFSSLGITVVKAHAATWESESILKKRGAWRGEKDLTWQITSS